MGFDAFQRLVDGGKHVGGNREADNGMIARRDGDLCLMAMFFYRENDFNFEVIAENFSDFCQAGFNFLADCGSDLILPSSVFHVH